VRRDIATVAFVDPIQNRLTGEVSLQGPTAQTIPGKDRTTLLDVRGFFQSTPDIEVLAHVTRSSPSNPTSLTFVQDLQASGQQTVRS
jgi:hypothetical protein